MLPLKIEIPQYPRRIQMAEKQRPKYYTWNGVHFLSGSKHLPGIYYVDPYYKGAVGKAAAFDMLKSNYTIGYFKGGNLVAYIQRETTKTPKTVVVVNEKLKDKVSDTKALLIDANTLQRVIANPKTVGTPKHIRINFQDMYSGNLHEHTRAKLVEELKNFMRPYVNELPLIQTYPVRMTLEIVDTVKNSLGRGGDAYGQAWDVDNRVTIYGKCIRDLLVELGKIPSDDRMFITQPGGGLFTPLPNDDDDTKRALILHIFEDDRPEIKNHPLYKNFNYELRTANVNPDGPTNPW